MSVVFPIENSDRYESYTASAGQTVFSVPFPFQDNADVTIRRIAPDGTVTILEEATDYTLIGAEDPAGGTFTLFAAATEGEKYQPIGEAVLERLTSVVRNGRFASKATDDELDRNRLIQQEQSRDIGRAFKADFGQTGKALSILPEGHFWKADAAGNMIDGGGADDIASAEENAAIATTAAAASAAAATAAAASAASIDYITVADRTALKAVDTGAQTAATQRDNGLVAIFDGADLSAEVTADPSENTYVAPNSDLTGASGAWVYKFGQYVPLFRPARVRSAQERLSEGVFLDDFLGADDTTKFQDFATNSDEMHLALPGRTINLEDTIEGTNKYWAIRGRGTAATRIEWQGTGGTTPVFKFIRDAAEIHALYQVSDIYFNTSTADGGIPIYVEEQRPDDASTYVLGGIDLLHIDRVIMEASGSGYWRRYLNSVNAGGIFINRFQARNNGSTTAQTDTNTKGLLFTNSQANLFIIRTLFMSQFNLGRVYNAIEFSIANSFESCYLDQGEIVGVRDGLLSLGAGKMGATGIGRVHMDVTHSGVFSNLTGGMNYIRLNGTDIRRGENGASAETGNCVNLAGASRYFTANGCLFTGNRTANPTMAQSGILFSGQEAGAIDGNVYIDLQYGNQLGNAVANVAVGDANVYDTVEQANIVTSSNASTISIGSAKGSWSTSVVKTLTGGAATEIVDIAIPAGVFTGDPSSATLVAESGAQFLVAIFQQTDANTTPTNARFLITRADGATITGGSVRLGVTAHA